MIDTNNIWMGNGGLTKDPEYREDIGLVTFSIAIDNAGYEDGQRATGYFDVSAWVKPSKWSPEGFGEYLIKAYNDKTLAKGSRVSVTGALRQERFKTKDGTDARKVVVTAENVRILWSHVGKERQQERNDAASSGGDEGSSSTSEETITHEPF